MFLLAASCGFGGATEPPPPPVNVGCNALAEGAPCDDGNLCTLGDKCENGACEPGVEADCFDTQCERSIGCEPTTGLCQFESLPDGTGCSDGVACTLGDRCLAGTCTATAGVVCETDEVCKASSCGSNGECIITNAADGSLCNTDVCQQGQTCTNGDCGGGAPDPCVSTDVCLAGGVCDPVSGCVFDTALTDGRTCLDDDLCTIFDSCRDGVCQGDPVVCDPATACEFAGVCDRDTGGCVRASRPDGTTCSDNNQCTQTDSCETGVCIGSDPLPPSGTRCSGGICFEDRALAAGLTWTSTALGSGMIGAAGAFLDQDGDGDLDVLLGAETNSPVLYRNLGDGSFVDATLTVALPTFLPPERFNGFAVADFDNDGDPDVYLLVDGVNRLLRNDISEFVDITATAGVGDASWSTAGAWGDYDQDGDLDLYVGNYVAAPNFPNHTPFPNRLYRNDGSGQFTDVTAALGVAAAGTTLAVTWSDFDGDGDVDLLVCNDFGAFVQPNEVFVNGLAQGSLSFTESAAALGLDVGLYCMGIAPGDFDHDGDLDFYFSNLGSNALMVNRGASGFVDTASVSGTLLTRDECIVDRFTTSWGVGFQDFDDDADLDLYVSNGWIPASASIANAQLSPNALLRNDGPGFTDISDTTGIDSTRIGRGAAFADFDQDGRVDALQVNVAGAAHLYRNVSPSGGNALRLSATGRISHRDALNTRIVLNRLPGQIEVREQLRNYSYLSSSERVVHFGLGALAEVDAVSLRYPSGIEQSLFFVPAGTYDLVEPLLDVLSSTSASTHAEGDTLVVSLTIENVTSAPLNTELRVELHRSGIVALAGAPTLQQTSPGTSLAATSVLIPVGFTQNTPTTFHVVTSVGDNDGGLDQARFQVTIVP